MGLAPVKKKAIFFFMNFNNFVKLIFRIEVDSQSLAVLSITQRPDTDSETPCLPVTDRFL